MTLATTPLGVRSASASSADARLARTEVVQTLCAVVAFVGLGFALMHSGGRDQGSAEIAIAMAAPSLVVGRVWRTLPTVEVAISAIVAAAAVAVPLLTPLGVSAARDLDAYLYAAVLYLAIRGYAIHTERRRLIMASLVSLGFVELFNVWPVWLGEHDPTYQVVGTFYWHNQFGAFAVAITLLATCGAMRSRRLEDAMAWVVAPLFAALSVFSQSRGALLGLGLTAATLALVTLVRKQWWPLLRLAVVTGLAVAVHVGFVAAVAGGSTHHAISPGRSSFEGTSEFRVNASRQAAHVFAEAPLFSHGYGSLGVLGWRGAPEGAVTSPYAHSAELQALSDGGLLLGVPVVVALALMAWASLRGVAAAASRAAPIDWTQVGIDLAAVGLLLHTSMDFDSQFPVLGAMLAGLVALGAPRGGKLVVDDNRLRLRLGSFAVLLAAVLVGAAFEASYWRTTHRLEDAALRLSEDSATSVATAKHALEDHRFRDPRPATFIVEATDLGCVFDDATLRRALRDSHSYAELDTQFAPIWAEVNRATNATSATP